MGRIYKTHAHTTCLKAWRGAAPGSSRKQLGLPPTCKQTPQAHLAPALPAPRPEHSTSLRTQCGGSTAEHRASPGTRAEGRTATHRLGPGPSTPLPSWKKRKQEERKMPSLPSRPCSGINTATKDGAPVTGPVSSKGSLGTTAPC